MTPRIAFAGREGAFGHEACLRFAPDLKPLARPDFETVARAVRRDEAELGVLPIENSTAGLVPGVLELIDSGGLAIRSLHRLEVRLHLLASPGTALNSIRKVVSHPMALAQCEAFLGRAGWALETASSTACAARKIACSGDPSSAAIASAAAVELYGLAVLRSDVQDRSGNSTLFALIARSSAQ